MGSTIQTFDYGVREAKTAEERGTNPGRILNKGDKPGKKSKKPEIKKYCSTFQNQSTSVILLQSS